MPRRAAAVRRETTPDAKYNNRLVSQLINKVMLDGKKSLAERIVYGAFDRVEEKTGEDALTVFKKANNTGAAVKKREDTYKMAESNRAFSHYRF